MRKTAWGRLALVAVLGACSAGSPSAVPQPGNEEGRHGAAGPGRQPSSRAASASRSRTETDALGRFETELARKPDLTYADFARELGLPKAADPPLPFDPTQLLYYERIARELALTDEEKAIFKKTGVVAVDHAKPYSIGSAYHAIYARDLPVLITTDSVLHALHRSYDNVLMGLETSALMPALDEALGGAHDVLAKRGAELAAPGLAESAADVDVYLTVARSLMAGKAVPSKLGRDAEVEALLAKIASVAPPTRGDRTKLHGGSRVVDFSQFRPRGHYTKSEALERYFRMMMWLGRPDTGFILAPPDPQSGLDVDPVREARSAALLTWTFETSGKLARVRGASNIIDFMVGASDNVTLDESAKALAGAGLAAPAAFADAAKIQAFTAGLAQASTQNVRAQFLTASVDGAAKVEAPKLFQLFGQRFTIDSFVLSQVVFDSIVFKGEKQLRMMPSGLDVMAALGSDEAALLLRPELERFNYGSNLLATRRVVEARSEEAWKGDVYSMWIDSLRALNRAPAGESAPTVMKREPWRRKTLETQLSSWSQLRHDTILYAKQSYTAFPLCGYPAGFVEPYPDFYAKLANLGRRTTEGLGGMGLAAESAHFQRFSDVMGLLERLAKKELAAQPFTKEEEHFLKTTIDISGGGSGPPRYDGWYPTLIFGEKADKWSPTIADVHTDPESGQALEVGVGNASFLVVAIDNGPDRAVYVGPISSFHSFPHPAAQRLTDEEWQRRLGVGEIPARPAFTSAYRGASKARDLGPRSAPHAVDPRLGKLIERLESPSTTPEERVRLHGEIEKLSERIRNPPLPPASGAPQSER